MNRSKTLVIGLALVLTSGLAAAQPVITGTNSDLLAHSGRLSIQGSGFGAVRGEVLVAGLPGLISTWKDTRIVAYVPEEAPIGPTEVVVRLDATDSNAMPLEVAARQADGRIDWVFEIDSEYIYYRPARAPDGTLYVHGYTYEAGGEGKVYALAPNGALKWITEVDWAAYVPPVAGPDGAVYVGSLDTLYRISPAGEIEWTFEGGLNIQSSAVIGPDGTVYTGFEQAPEAVALDPATGTLIWSNSPGLSAFGTGGTEARLGRSTPDGPYDRFYLWWDALAAFSLDGEHLFTTSAGNIYDHEVAVGSDGTLYAPAQWDNDLAALSPFNGAIQWIADGPWNVVRSDVEIGPDDMLYFVGTSAWLNAFDPHSQTTLWNRDIGHYLSRPSLTPDGTMLLTSGGGTCNDPAGCTISFVKAIDTTNGDELWHIDLDEAWDPDYRSVTWDHARISADSKNAYFTGWVAGSEDYLDERSLLWAVDLEDPDIFSDGFESGDTSAWDLVQP